MNIELYINNRLCDIESPEKLGITLKRVFINSSELNVKDAQKSYNISLPATRVNNEIFNYANVEETQGKFKIYGDARLYVNGVLILDGKFRLSEITKDYYRGNLGVPAPLTVKDVFGETMMNQAGRWPVEYNGIDSISETNKKDNPDCIFPFVLYGLLNKYDPTGKYYSDIQDEKGNKISYKQIYDGNVMNSIKDFPPSMNCIKMLENIFNNAGYTLNGSAIKDERLRNLYVSYKNPSTHEAVWGVDKTKISGTWTNYGTRLDGFGNSVIDHHYIHIPGDSDDGYITGDMLNSRLTRTSNVLDPGMNITTVRTRDGMLNTFKVPHSGLYKLFFKAKFRQGTSGTHGTSPIVVAGKLNNQFYEIKVLRFNERDIVEQQALDNMYYRDNINQFYGTETCIFPQKHALNFIDPKVNRHLLCGISVGGEQLKEKYPQLVNPLAANEKFHNPMAITGGTSWTTRENVETSVEKEIYRAFSAVKSNSYLYGNNQFVANSFIVPLENVPSEEETKTTRTNDDTAEGQVSQVVWLEKDEILTIVSVTPFNRKDNIWNHHYVDFELSLTPFKKNKNWITVDTYGKGDISNPMNWEDEPDYKEGEMDLAAFLPGEVKINDWVDNFCKAFNLELINKGNKIFELNIKRNGIVSDGATLIDLDHRTSIMQRRNESLKLPQLYEIGFTIDTSEEGYFRTMEKNENDEPITNSGIDGKGRFYTGSNETSALSQTSSFSYCWYKDLFDDQGKPLITVPVISDHEIWDNDYDYLEMMGKTFYDKAQRFWYKNGTFNVKVGEKSMSVALVTNEYNMDDKSLSLDYFDMPGSIMRNFFLILADSNNNYTSVGCYLTAAEYALLGESLIKFNGDIYNVAEIDGYDPLGYNPCTLKLIRKLIE